MKKCALERSDLPQLVADVSGRDWESIVALELRYHRSCYTNYVRKSKKIDVLPEQDGATMILMEYVQKHVIECCEVLTTDILLEVYQRNAPENNMNPDKRTIIEHIKKKFDTSIAAWSPKHGNSFIFNNNIEKGEVIEILLKKIESLTTQQKEKPLDEKIKEVGEKIRNDVITMPLTYQHWPPQEEQLLNNETNLPPSLYNLLSSILSSNKPLSSRKSMLVNSIGQDIIYNANDDKYKTQKHVNFSLCTKRKTGSRVLLKWINRYGHGVSYDEVSVVEIFLAEEFVRNQSPKSFCPYSLLPMTFLTLVWDNNDINPDFLTGLVMHCTNGIAIQLLPFELVQQVILANPVSVKTIILLNLRTIVLLSMIQMTISLCYYHKN